MKRNPILASVAMALLAVVSAVGAASASASTVLCDTPRYESSSCPAAGVLPAGTNFQIGGGGTIGGTDGLRVKSNGTTLYQCSNYMRFESTAEAASYFLPANAETYISPNSCTFKQDPTGACSSATLSASGADFRPALIGEALIRVGTASAATLDFTCTNLGYPPVTCKYEVKGVLDLVTDEESGAVATTSEEALSFAGASPAWYAGAIGCGKGSSLTLSIDDVGDGANPYVSISS